jgi:hypothetical protein
MFEYAKGNIQLEKYEKQEYKNRTGALSSVFCHHV